MTLPHVMMGNQQLPLQSSQTKQLFHPCQGSLVHVVYWWMCWMTDCLCIHHQCKHLWLKQKQYSGFSLWTGVRLKGRLQYYTLEGYSLGSILPQTILLHCNSVKWGVCGGGGSVPLTGKQDSFPSHRLHPSVCHSDEPKQGQKSCLWISVFH